jgi:hypothetical protein
MLKTLFLHPLGPALILALGGLLLQLGTRRGNNRPGPMPARPPSRAFVVHLPGRASGRAVRWEFSLRVSPVFIALAFVVCAGIDLALLRRVPASIVSPPSMGYLRWAWQPLTVAGSELIWRMNGWSWLVALLLLLVVAAALLLQAETPAPTNARRTPSMLWLGAAALAFVFSGNVVTLASCWVLLDLALALQLGPASHEQTAGRAWSLMSVAGLILLAALLVLGEGGIRVDLASGPFGRPELALLWLAALIRAGVYPFHLWLTQHEHLDRGDCVALHLVVPLTGLWLLARVHQVAGPGWLRRPEWAALGALALLGSALAAWTAEDRALAWRWVAVNRASLVVMAAYMADLAGPPALAWSLITFALGLTLLIAGQTTRERWGWVWPGILGALAIWGLPGTPGFLARSALVLPVRIQGAVLLFGIVLVAETLLVATLWRLATGNLSFALDDQPPALDRLTVDPQAGRQLRRPSTVVLSWPFVGLAALVVLVAVPTLAWGAAPRQVGELLGRPASGLGALPLGQIILEARRSVWGVLLVSGAAGVALGLLRQRIFAGMRGWQQGIHTLVGLEWLYQAVAVGFGVVVSGLGYFAALGEGEGYLGWVLLAGLILWVLLRG